MFMATSKTTSTAASLASGLDESDLAVLLETLYPMTNKYKRFALQIGVENNEITTIEKQFNAPGDCLMEILSFRLKQGTPLTWANIVKALRSQSVGEHQLADKIEKRFCSDDPCSEAGLVHVDVGEGQSKSGTLEKTSCSSGCSRPLDISSPQLEPQGNRKQIRKAKEKRKKAASARCKVPDDDLDRKEEEVVEMSDESSSPSSSGSEIFRSEEEIEPPCNLPSTGSKSSADYSKKRKRKRKTKAQKSEMTKKSCTKESDTMEDEKRETTLATEKSTQELLEHKRKGKKRRRRNRSSQQSKLHTEPERSVVEMKRNESSATSSDDETIVHMGVKESSTPLDKSEKDGNKVRKRKRMPKREDGESESEGKESIEKMSSKKRKPTQDNVKCKVRKRKRKSKSRASPAAILDKIHSPLAHHRTQQTMEKGCSEKESSSDASSDGEQLEQIQRESQHLQRKGKVPSQRSTGKGKASKKPSLDQQIEGEYSSPYDSGSEPHKKRKSRKRRRDGSSGNGSKGGQSSGLVVDNIQNELEDEVESCSEGSIEHDSERFPSTEEETESTTTTSEEEESSQSDPYGGRRSKRRKKNRRRGNGKYRGRQRKHTFRGQRKKHKHDNGDQKQMMKRERKEEKMTSSSETDDSISPEREGLKRLSKDEAKNLKKLFKSFYGRLCVAISDPASLAVQLQTRALLSRTRMEDILQSPESRQSKAITLVRALQRRINGRPNKLFDVIQLCLENECLKKEGREMWTKTGELCPNRTAAVLGSKLPPPPAPPTPPHSLPRTSHTPPPPSYPTPLPPSHSLPHPPPSSLSPSTPLPLPGHANAAISSTAGESSKDATTSETVNQPNPSLSPIVNPAIKLSQSMPQLNSSPVLSDYSKYLKSCYKARPLPQADKFLPTLSAPYINLAMVSREDSSPEDRDEFTRQTLHGGVDQILKRKTPIAMEDLLSPEKNGEEPVRFVLVEGPPGIGKSTFVWEICRRWDKILGDYQIVVMLRLREKWVLNAKSLSDLFRSQFQPELSHKIAKELHDCCGRDLLLILDGFDEVSHSFHKDSVIKSILCRQLLPECTIILTTRPSAKDTLLSVCQPRVNKHVEIIGFTEEDRVRYITEVFNRKPELQANFLKYMFLIPHIKSMMYIPLNCAIIAKVYSESLKNCQLTIPRTRTQIYKALTHCLLVRHLKTKNKENQSSCMLPEGLEEEDMENFKALAKFAFDSYHGNKSRRVTFFKEDIPEELVHFGMMNESREMYAEKGVEKTFSFLHLSLQEYLAAWHIAHSFSTELQVAYSSLALKAGMSISKSMPYKGNSTEEEALISSLKSLEKSLMEPALFLAGITGWRWWDSNEHWEMYISHVISRTQYIFGAPSSLFHFLYETQNQELISHCYSSETSITPVISPHTTPYDSFALSYCLAHSSRPINLTIHRCNLSCVETFVKGLNDHCISSLPIFKSLNVNFSGNSVFWLTKVKSSFKNTEHLSVLSSNLNTSHCLSILESMVSLQTLNIILSELGNWNWLPILKSMSQLKKIFITSGDECNLPPTDLLCWLVEHRLTELLLNIKRFPYTSHDLHTPTDCLIHSVLKSVLRSNQITELLLPNVSRETMAGVRNILLHCPRLVRLELVRTRLGYDGILFICGALRKNTTLKYLTIDDIQLPQESPHTSSLFTSMIRYPLPDKTTCTEFLLELDNILKNNKTLETITILSGLFIPPLQTCNMIIYQLSEWTGLGPLEQFNKGVVASGRSPNLRRSFSSSDLTQPKTTLFWNRARHSYSHSDGNFKELFSKRREDGRKLFSLPSFTAPDTPVLQSFSHLDHRLKIISQDTTVALKHKII